MASNLVCVLVGVFSRRTGVKNPKSKGAGASASAEKLEQVSIFCFEQGNVNPQSRTTLNHTAF